MAVRKVPLGTAYTGTQGHDVISFPVTLRVIGYEVLDTLADFAADSMIQGTKIPAPSSFGVKKVREVLEQEYTSRGGSAAGDQVYSLNDEKEKEWCYTWAEKVLARVWPGANFDARRRRNEDEDDED